MNRVLPFPNEQAFRDQVAAWIAKIDRGLLPAEREELQRWFAEDARHRTALLDMAALWDRMDVLSEIAALFPLHAPQSRWSFLTTRPVILSFLLVMLTVGAGGVWVRQSGLSGHAMFAWGTRTGPTTLDATYTTSVGEQRAVNLPDQSTVTLNTATLLRVHYTPEERRMELIQGEAHFQVAKHEGRVFSVHVGPNEFRAVGTAFDIRVKSERGIELTVTEGRVEVRTPSSADASHVAQPNVLQPAPTQIVVDAGKEVAIDTAIQTVQRLQPTQLEAALAWKSGMIIFDADPLEKAIREVSRYSTTKLVIVDERTKKIPVSGYFKVGDVNGLVTTLHNSFRIDATRDGDVIILSAAK